MVLRVCCQGIFITRVADDGPSSLAGLRAGDRLLSVGLLVASCPCRRRSTSGVGTGGSGGSMNRGPRAPGAPE